MIKTFLTECAFCNKEILKPQSALYRAKLRNQINFFCNKKCKDDYERSKAKKYKGICTFCNKSFERILSEVDPNTKNVFCSRYCWRRYQADRKISSSGSRAKKCIDCGCEFVSTKKSVKKRCRNCQSIFLRKSYNILKKDSTHAKIRRCARHIMLKEPKICFVCGYCKFVEVCHIKPVSSFSDDCKLIEINSRENLVYLCPNCHWELDHNLLKL